MRIDRRTLLKGMAGAGSALAIGGTLPGFLARAAASAGRHAGDRILVVVQLSGGNDGLNTVVPHKHEAYRAARPTLRIDSADVLAIDDELGLHPACRSLADALEAGRLGIVQGVGYDQPNRSHFESMDIWHSCRRKEDRGQEGWLGRAFDLNGGAEARDPLGIFLGESKLPASLVARATPVPSIDSPERFRLQGQDAEALSTALSGMSGPAETSGLPSEAAALAEFLERSTGAALEASRRIEAALAAGKAVDGYPASRLAEKLSTVGRLIEAGLSTRVYYVELDGFDTHSQQAEAHRGLLEQWSGALGAFLQDLAGIGRLDDTIVVSFSEFGRRVAENASEGTDHGAAAPLFLAGGRVAPGVHGAMPSLTDLDDGDQKFHTDFRRVYATLLEEWLGWDASAALGRRFETLPLIRA